MQLVLATKSDIAYLTDLYEKFNAMNLQLQGNMVTLVKCKTVSSFIGKLKLYKQNIGRREFYQFPRLAELELTDDDLLQSPNKSTCTDPNSHSYFFAFICLS